MGVRIKSRWSAKGKERSVADTASALAFNMWKVAADRLLELETEGFQTDTHEQRIHVISEFLIFMIHMVDRLVYEKMSDEDRGLLINALAKRLAQIAQDNFRDTVPEGDHVSDFINRLNKTINDYSDFSFEDEKPGFGMLRLFGENVTRTLGEKDKKWITTQVIDIEAPDTLRYLKRILGGLIKTST
ncbi:MAG: hypothetical protein GXP22_07205 [Gammaproteobacteria bacterium]|nr:hypothetical protein [Gammaproteobacteria bacterium]